MMTSEAVFKWMKQAKTSAAGRLQGVRSRRCNASSMQQNAGGGVRSRLQPFTLPFGYSLSLLYRPVYLLLAALLAAGCQQLGGAAEEEGARGIQPYEKNPRYWQYEGEPVMLLGGTKEDNLFQIAELEEHLDRLVAVGGNYIRNTMSSRDEGNIWPFHQEEAGTYDLDRWNEAYWGRFEKLLRLAQERDIIVQIELWDRFDFARAPWQDNPFRPANNVNYSAEESGLQNAYPEHPGSNNNPFFRSVPDQDDNRLLLGYQQKYIDRLLAISLRYPNVLYTMDNETSANPDWGAYWARYVKKRAREAGAEVQTTEMWDAWDLKDEEHRRTLDHPALYEFVDISQNNHNEGEEHWANLQWVRRYTEKAPRPLNNVKIYGADTGQYGTARDAVERFWRSILGGAASMRFHRPPAGIGLNDRAQAQISSARMLLRSFDLFRAVPDADSRLLGERGEDEAYLSSVPEKQYAVYFPDGGSVRLDLREAPGRFHLRWLNTEKSQWQGAGMVEGGQAVTLKTPSEGNWIALLDRR